MSEVLKAIQQFYPDYHPLVAIAHIAHTESVEPRLKFDCHRVIAKYVEPELKSLEVRGVVGEARRVSVSLFEDNQIIDAEMVDVQPVGQLVDKIVDGY